MIKSYSVLVLRGTQIHRFAVSPHELRQLVWLALTVLALVWVHVTDELALEKRKTAQVVAMAQTQREKLTFLRDRTKEVELSLAHWKGLREKIQASMPLRKSGGRAVQYEGEELNRILLGLEGELRRMINSLPSEWPVEGRVVSGIGMRPSPLTGKMEFHAGLDIPKPIGTPVHASGDAVVKSVDEKLGAVVLDHGQDINTHYAHLSKIFVNQGERVRKGQEIAQVGNTGKSTGPHLHYEVRVDGVAVDPRKSLLSASAPN